MEQLLEWVGNSISPIIALILLPAALYLALLNYLPVKPRSKEKENER